MKAWLKGAVIGAAASFAVTGANAATNLLFIVDASNSMWGQIAGTAKIETAKSTLDKLLTEIPVDSNVGLMAYGHRQKDDCKDVELMQPVGPIKLAALKKSLDSLTPTGKTPIANALQQSAAAFSEDTTQRSVVLISDGIETCDPDPCAAARALAGAVLLALAAWLFERSKGAGARALMVRGAAAVAALLAIAPLVSLKIVDTAQASSGTHGGVDALTFDPAGIENLRAEGRGVFIDFTAAWCVTCQVNKLTVLSRADVAQAFAAGGTALMVADWTRRDPVITEALAAFGANGVPLYVYYPPQGEPVVLAQPLSARAVIEAVSQPSKGS